MKAYVIEQPGGPEVLKMREIAPAAPGVDEVRIRVCAFGINRAEADLRAGRLGPIAGSVVPGIEAVGVVAEDPSKTFRVGERVATAMGGLQVSRNGSYAEEVTVLRRNVVALGSTILPWEELATLPLAYLTAWGALAASLEAKAGQTLLVRGGTSAVGLAAIAYANAFGLNVLATTRSATHVERLYHAGAHEVLIDSGEVAAAVARECLHVDAALEIVSAANVCDTAKMVRPFGGVTVVGTLAGPPLLAPFDIARDLPPAVRLSFFTSDLLGTKALPLDYAPLRFIASGIASRSIASLHAYTFEFDEIRKAHYLLESNRALGKIVVRL
ncbi:zinc-binding dehydrogenase [Paraburkholderia sp. J7]|uniref:zinc-binding dehydrogenase n=1 Tax=Paraburkholderia sp. J7 TaxID=2805438 RepID=UPI002AB699D1|nr:zinc-binding dehydrogenase [Paraburkholderia sp. J7]